jgi:hypothetical protein
LRLDNPSDRPKKVELSMDLRGASAGSRPVRIDWPDGPEVYAPDGSLHRSLVVPPGGSTLLFSTSAAGAPDPKAPAFRVERFTIAESDPTLGRLAGDPAGAARR